MYEIRKTGSHLGWEITQNNRSVGVISFNYDTTIAEAEKIIAAIRGVR